MTAKTPNLSPSIPPDSTDLVLRIRDVKDSSGSSVINNAITFDTAFTFNGEADPDRDLVVKDGFAELVNVRSDEFGYWHSEQVELKVPKRYTLTVVDGNKPPSTPTRNFTVAISKPVIDTLADEERELAEADETFFTSVTVKGKARPDEQVRAYNGSDPLEVGPTGSSGDYTIVLKDLKVEKTYSIVIKALYGDFESDPRSFTVRDDVAIALNSVEDSTGAPVNEGTVTFDDTLTIKGKARPLASIQLLDKGSTMGSPVTVEDSGDWVTEIGFVHGGHSLAAKKLYGDNAVTNPPRTFTVLRNVDLSLDAVEDSQGNPVANDSVTFDTKLTVRGKATPRERVQLLNDGVALGSPSPPADDDEGAWEIELSVAKSSYKLTAKEVNTGHESTPPWNFTVLTDVDLALEDVEDSKGQTVEADAIIREDRVTVSGKATPRETVQLLNNGTPTDATGPVDDDGFWEMPLPVSPGNYSLTAKEVTSGEESSQPRTFSVRAAFSATLDSVMDTHGQEIEKEGFTYETTLIVKGMAEAGETVELFDGEDSLGPETVLDSGIFEKTITGLEVKPYSLQARPNYPEGGNSERYAFEVRARVAPRDTQVHDANGLIEDNGNTRDTYVVVRGRTESFKSVQIKVNDVVNPGIEPANEAGAWAAFITDLNDGTTYVVSAVSSEDNDAESNIWTFTKVAAGDSTD